MKTRSRFLALAALLFLSWDASAQTIVARRPATSWRPMKIETKNQTAPKLGSYERTRLLTKYTRGRMTPELARLGSVDRRTLLMTGKSIHPKRPKTTLLIVPGI